MTMFPARERGPARSLVRIASGTALIALANWGLGGWITPPEGEYRAGYIVILVALLIPGLLGGLLAGMTGNHSRAAHGSLAGLGIFVLELVFGAVGSGIDIGTVIVRSVGFTFGAVAGGYGAVRLAEYLERRRTAGIVEPQDGETSSALLEVDGLTMHYRTSAGWVSAVDNVTFRLHRGQALGLVGESGCGKTSVAMSLLRLIADNGEFRGGEIRLGGVDLLQLSEDDMRDRRWADIAMVFQGAMNAWNPVYTVYDQIREAMVAHADPGLTEDQIRERVAELFELVGLNPEAMDRYPHQFSGGMRQRAVIAMALSCDPKVIIADEPTTALDVIVQDQILKELKKVQSELGMSIIYISHDIAVIAEVTEVMGVMYAGRMVEFGPTEEVFARPRHPYTYLLLRSTPSISGPRRPLAPLEGEPPNLIDPPGGCRFHPRCPFATERCRHEEPGLAAVDGGADHRVACWNWTEVPVGMPEEVTA